MRLARHLRLYWLPIVFGCYTGATYGQDSPGIDPGSGLKIAAGWEEVKARCTLCHSAQFITHQQGDKDSWLAVIRWMQKTQGLGEFDPATEAMILDYLATNYPPGKVSRRANLPPSALPANPWE